MTENLTDAENVSIYHRYINTPIQMEAPTIKEAIHKGHYQKNMCWVNALTDFYGETLMSEKTKKRLTSEKIIELINKKDFYEKGASITDMQRVFEEYNIQVRIFNFFNHLIYKYDPPKRNHHIKTFYAMVKNSHIYVLNHDLKSIQQKQISEIPIVKATTDYYINEKEEPCKFKMIKHVDDMLKIEVKDDEKEIKMVMEDNSLTKAFFDLINSGYEPEIIHQAGIITDIRLDFSKVRYVIKTQNLLKDTCDGCITLDDEKTYNNMNVAFFNFNKALFNPLHKSFYNDIDIKIFKEAGTIVPSGLISKKLTLQKCTELDVSKAFKHAFVSINEIPVFTQFDLWKPYDESIDIEKLHDLTLYYVQVLGTIISEGTAKGIEQIRQDKIRNMSTEDIDKFIDEYALPAQTQMMFNKRIDDFEIDKGIKKLIPNVNFGLLEKGGSTAQKSLAFKNLNEALAFQTEYGGKLNRLSDIEMLDEYGEQLTGNSKDYYILNLKDKAELKNGFKYIKELLLQHHNFKMQQAFYKLIKNNVHVHSVKTDAFVIDTFNVERARGLLDFHDDVGGWRVSKEGEEIKLPTTKYQMVENDKVEIPEYECKELMVKDEYDTDDIIDNHIVKNNPVMILGLFAGTGKSYICQRMVERNYNVVFVCPTNRLLQSFEGHAMTINKFFGISFGDVKLEPYDYSYDDVIVFDEVYFSSLSTYWKIKQFTEENKHNKIIIATGDAKQLKPVQELTNTQDYEQYANKIVENIFEYKIVLKECKRLHTQEDKDKLTNIKRDIFEKRLSTKKIIEKYFSYTDDITASPNNIAYLNDTCKNVSREIRKLENRRDEYEVGECLICREFTKTTQANFNVNFKYEIVSVDRYKLSLKNVKTGAINTLAIEKVRKNFIFAWCATAHSMQGASVDTDITIFDYNHFLVKDYPEWIYTCVTRSRDLNRVKFFRYKTDKNDDLNKQFIMSYFERKIENYKIQDRSAKRKIPKQGYVNSQWFIDNINNQCNYCGCGFYLNINKGNISSNLSAQRVNNDLTHTLDNIVPYCVRCNCSCR
eukprot:Skav223953  [mRNA]  locus=scaffold798:243805:247131:- [translate_table: standard]